MMIRVTTFKGFLAWVALVALLVLGLVTGWTQAFLGWALPNLVEALIPDSAEWKAQ